MTELIEGVLIGMVTADIEAHCPFAPVPAQGASQKQDEDIKKDDLDAATEQQENDGGELGRNLINGSHGADGTVAGPYSPPNPPLKAQRLDTPRTQRKVSVLGTDATQGYPAIGDRSFGFTVAAHHLIPGEASLAKSTLIDLMTEGSSVDVQTTDGGMVVTKTISKHIGYNVNGSHNGVWLPGNYYIRKPTSPIKNQSWSDLGNHPWCLNYVAAVTKGAGGQMHDAHTKYSEAVLGLLNTMADLLLVHACAECEPQDINPPFMIKQRLYGISARLREQLTAAPAAWKRPWYASDRWRDDAFVGDQPSPAFMVAYNHAELEDPGS